MAAKTYPNRIDLTLSNEIKNGLRMAGFDLTDVGPDRPIPPDGHKLIIEMWNAGTSIEEIMKELRLSEARLCAELLYLAMKGRIERRIKLAS